MILIIAEKIMLNVYYQSRKGIYNEGNKKQINE